MVLRGVFVAGVLIPGLDHGTFSDGITDMLDSRDATCGVYKLQCVGIVVLVVCCLKGYHARFGVGGVGKTTTAAVVISAVLNYLFNTVLL